MLEKEFCAFIENARYRYSSFADDSAIKYYHEKYQSIFPNPDPNEKTFAFLCFEKFRWFKKPEEIPCILLTDRHIYLPHERGGKAIPLSGIAKFRLHTVSTSNGISVALKDGT